MLRMGFLVLALALTATAASADTMTARGQQYAPVHVSVAVNFYVNAPTDGSAAALKAQADARRTVYEAATHECAVLLDTMASDCRLEQLNVNINVNRNYNPQIGEGFTVSGNMRFIVTLK